MKLWPLHQIVSQFERLRFPSGANLGPASFRERYCRVLFILSNYISVLEHDSNTGRSDGDASQSHRSRQTHSQSGWLDAGKLSSNCYLIANNSNKVVEMINWSCTMGSSCKQSHWLQWYCRVGLPPKNPKVRLVKGKYQVRGEETALPTMCSIPCKWPLTAGYQWRLTQAG